jgi:hypothetical protein
MSSKRSSEYSFLDESFGSMQAPELEKNLLEHAELLFIAIPHLRHHDGTSNGLY